MCAVWLTYLPSINGPFIFDDKALPFAATDAASKPAAFWIGGVRPVLMASYWLNFISGQSPFGYHAVNLCLHALATALVFLCALFLLRKAGVDDSKLRVLAILTAGIFALHPLQAESVAYIAGRSEVLAGVFVFGGLAVFLGAPRGKFGLGRVLSVLALTFAALLTKEHTVILPVLLLFTGIFWSKEGVREHLRNYAKLYGSLAVLAIIAGVLVVRRLANSPSAGFNLAGISAYEYFLTECRVIPVYLRLFIAPIGQNADWTFPLSHSLLDHGAVFYGLGILCALVLSFRYRHRAPLLCYGLLIFFLLLTPTSSFVPIRDVLAERRMYLPIFGLALAAAMTLAQFRLRLPTMALLAAGIIAAAGGASYRRAAVWNSEIHFWQDVVTKSPSNVRAYEALGAAFAHESRCREAIGYYNQALERSKASDLAEKAGIKVSLASTYVCNHEPEKARETLRGMTSSEQGAVILTELGVAAAKANNSAQALEDFGEAIRLTPAYAPPYAYRGLVEGALSRYVEAEADFHRALTLDPGNAFALDGLRKLSKLPH